MKLFSPVLCLCVTFLGLGPLAQAQSYELLHALYGPLDGDQPKAPLVQGRDGNFYGSTFYGGSYNRGTVFRITPAGTFTVLAVLDDNTGWEQAQFTAGADGNFYG